MGEEIDSREEMAPESRKLDLGGGDVNVEELLRMLEVAVEKEFVGMKKTSEGLGANSDFIQQSENYETTSSSSAGTPTSMYSACSASGSTFSACSDGKEKTSQEEDLRSTADQTHEAGWTERQEAFQAGIRTKLGTTSSERRGEATLETINESQLDDVDMDAVSGSRASRLEASNNVDTNVPTPQEILQNLIQGVMELGAHHVLNQTAVETSFPEMQLVPDDDMCTHDLSINSNASVENVVPYACNPCESALPSGGVVGPNTTTARSTKSVEARVQCGSENSLDLSINIVKRTASSDLRGHDSLITPLNTGEKKMEGFVRGTKGVSSDLDRADGSDKALNASVEHAEGVVFAIRDIYSEFASHARTSLLEAIQTLDCGSPKIFNLRGDEIGRGWLDANFDYCGDNEESARLPIQVKDMNLCNLYMKTLGHGSLSEGHELSRGEIGESLLEPCANGLKDGKKIEEKVQSENSTGNGVGIHVDLQKVNARTKNSAVLSEHEVPLKQLVTLDHGTAGTQVTQPYKSTPEVPGRVFEEMVLEATDHVAVDRYITAYEYSQACGCDEAKLITVSDLTHTSKDHHCSLRPDQVRSRKSNSINVNEVTQRADQATEDSAWPFEYHMGLRTAENPTVAPNPRITLATNRGQVYCGDSSLAGQAHSEDDKLVRGDGVVEHAVGFRSNCCTPSRRSSGLAVQSGSCSNKRTLVRDSSQASHSVNENDNIFSSSTFLEMEKAASAGVLRINSKQFSNSNKVESSDSYNESTQSASPETFFDRLLRYGRSVSCARSESSIFSKLAGEVTKRSNSGECKCREKMKVVIRMRPFAENEKMCPLKQILCLPEDKVIVKENNGYTDLLKQSCIRSKESRDAGCSEYTVDNVVDDSYLQKHRWDKKAESQKRMYELIGLPCLEYALDGYNTTIIAYGQGGSGKTFTMMGDGTDEGRGIMPRLAEELMNQINTKFGNKPSVQVSYLEIYQERIRDLLVPSKVGSETSRAEWQGSMDSGVSRCGSVNSERRWSDSLDDNAYEESMDSDTASYLSFGAATSTSSRRAPSLSFDCPSTKKESLKVREHPLLGPYVEGLLWKDVFTWNDMEQVMMAGAARRTLGATASNRFSNRGHTLFTIRLFKDQGERSSNVRFINLVDLAGTEKPNLAKRISLERLDESRYINRSIAHLNDVILNLSKNSKFVSYRNSSLTKLLRHSLGGTYKTFLIAHLSPAEQDFQESVNSLRYAAKASHIQSIIFAHPEKR